MISTLLHLLPPLISFPRFPLFLFFSACVSIQMAKTRRKVVATVTRGKDILHAPVPDDPDHDGFVVLALQATKYDVISSTSSSVLPPCLLPRSVLCVLEFSHPSMSLVLALSFWMMLLLKNAQKMKPWLQRSWKRNSWIFLSLMMTMMVPPNQPPCFLLLLIWCLLLPPQVVVHLLQLQ